MVLVEFKKCFNIKVRFSGVAEFSKFVVDAFHLRVELHRIDAQITWHGYRSRMRCLQFINALLILAAPSQWVGFN